MEVSVHLYTQSEPIHIADVRNAYQKGDFYCVMSADGKNVWKYPLLHLFRAVEVSAASEPITQIEKLDVEVHLQSQSQPVRILGARNCYQKGDLQCVMSGDGRTVQKFPVRHIFRLAEHTR